MSKKHLETPPLATQSTEQAATESQPQHAPIQAVTLCMLALILCTLVSVSPLLHLAGKTFLLPLPTNPLLLIWGSWLPYDLHVSSPQRASMITTNDLEFLLLIALAFGIYALCALLIRRQPASIDYTRVIRLIWLGTIVAGLIYVLTPAMLSRDIFVYAGFGRLIVAHHANPYFVAPSAFPQDPITDYDDWKYATSAYGPVWLAICSIWAFLIGTFPLGYVLAFRLFDLAAHLANTWLVATILKKMGCSARTVTLGTLLYAWNPLALMESSLGGHNDTFMVTLILLGILLCLRAEQRSFARPLDYLPPIIAFTLATLVKFTAAPLIAFFLVLLAYGSLKNRELMNGKNVGAQFIGPWDGGVGPWLGRCPIFLGAMRHTEPTSRFARNLKKVLLAGIASGLVALTFYAPFWIHHSLHDIVRSFSTPPSSYFSENSLLRAIYEWVKGHGLPLQTSWTYWPVYIFSLHSTWNAINTVTLLVMLILGTLWIWRVPTTRTMILAALATLGVLLIVTPWFFAWYATWLVGLAAICLSTVHERKGRALVAFALTFSLTAFVTYLFNGYPPIGRWSGFAWLLMIGPTLLVFFVFVARKNTPSLRSLSDNRTITA